MNKFFAYLIMFCLYLITLATFNYSFLYLEVITHERAHAQVLEVWDITNYTIEYNYNPFNNKDWAGRVVYSETANATCTENCKLALANLHNFSPYIQSFGVFFISFIITYAFCNIINARFFLI